MAAFARGFVIYFYVDAGYCHYRSNVFLFAEVVCVWWGKSIILIMCIVVAITEVFGFLEPESTYKQIQTRKQDVIYTLKNCRISAFEAQQAGFLAKAKDAGLARMA